MADYIYLLESRLSHAQQRAIAAIRGIARDRGLTVFLVGGAVRDLTSGSPVRDLDVAVQGNALKLKKDLEKAGAVVTGENEFGQSLFVSFAGSVRIEVGSILSVHYPKPGKPVVKPATILDDLRRRDFTANAMALSLNEGSYGLLMDPLNGVADIENRELRLVSNYGFIEDPVRMIRAARFAARLGWQLEEKTKARYETGKAEGYISAMSAFHRGYEAEEIVHEEDPLRVLRGLENEGWMKVLCAAWGSAKANVAELEKLREAQMQLQMRGIVADASAAQFPLLTAKMQSKDVASLKKMFVRQGFVKDIEGLEAEGKRFAADLSSKQAAQPSAAWKLLLSARPEAVLWTAYSTKNAGLLAKFQSFYSEWPQARQKIPYTLMQEMRIVPGLEGYDDLVEKVFFELMDSRLATVEEMKAFLEPYSPPAPPPPVHLRRARGMKKDAKISKARKKANADEAEGEDATIAPAAATVIDLDGAAGVPTQAGPARGKAAGSKGSEGKVAMSTKAAAPAKAVVPVKATGSAGRAKAAKKVAEKPPARKPSQAKKPVAAAKPATKKPLAAKRSSKESSVGKVAAKKSMAKKHFAKKPAKPMKKAVAKQPAKSAAKKKPVASAAAKSGSRNSAKSAVKKKNKKKR